MSRHTDRSTESADARHARRAGVVEKFGVSPQSIPDYLALVGDSADGYPGLRGWGAKSSAAVLAKFVHLESIPTDWREWQSTPPTPAPWQILSAASATARCSSARWRRFETDLPLFDDVGQLRWKGQHPLSTRSRHVGRCKNGKTPTIRPTKPERTRYPDPNYQIAILVEAVHAI